MPSAPPSNITARNTSSTSILVEWSDVPKSDRNGIIIEYKVYVKESTSAAWQGQDTIAVPGRLFEKTGLKHWTNYDVKVAASTAQGEGVISDVIQIRTDEDSEFQFDYSGFKTNDDARNADFLNLNLFQHAFEKAIIV